MADAFRPFRVVRKVPESGVITSFHLEPADGGAVFPVRPGQYLTLRVPAPGGPVLKTYSVSCDPSEPRFHRISVKREGRPMDAPDAPDGVGSGWLHDIVAEGDMLDIAAPRGDFVLDEGSARPVVLLSGGVGLTPLLSMLHRLAETDRDVWFIHACENGGVHAMHSEIAALAAKADGRIRSIRVYRAPTEADRAAEAFDAEGMIDRALLQSLLPLDDYDIYMCGPVPFMVAMYRLLGDLGVAKDRIAYEFFGKAASLEALAATPAPAAAKVPSRAPAAIASLAFLTDPDARAVAEDRAPDAKPMPLPEADVSGDGDVTFRKSGVTVDWTGAADSLLDLAEEAGLAPEFSCRNGICGTCACRLIDGDVDYFEEPLAVPPEGHVLICSARPRGPVVLDL